MQDLVDGALPLITAGLGVSVSGIDATWATPVNSFLLLMLAVVALYTKRDARNREDRERKERHAVAAELAKVSAIATERRMATRKTDGSVDVTIVSDPESRKTTPGL